MFLSWILHLCFLDISLEIIVGSFLLVEVPQVALVSNYLGLMLLNSLLDRDDTLNVKTVLVEEWFEASQCDLFLFLLDRL